MGMLGKEAILHRFDEIFPSGGAEESNVKAAKYYLTLSKSLLILPNGKRYVGEHERGRPVVIEPGQTAYVSSAERVLMPPDLAGIIGPRYSIAEQGFFFFGGMLVDPGWGAKDGAGEPLSFHVANLGRMPLEIRPGEDFIASLAFLEVEKESRRPSRWRRRPPLESDPTETAIQVREDLFSGKSRSPSALGLVEDLGHIRNEIDKLSASVTQVVLFGVIVLAATLFAGLIAAILGSSGGSGVSIFGSGGSGANELSASSLWELGLSFGVVVAAIALLVALFYGMAKAFARWMAWQRGRRLRS
ncbi:MAG: dCTP deaminase domain-containing protein [Solirubrobacterales bacterium]